MIRFDRRLFLGGASALLALPWLESLGAAQSAKRPRRFIAFFTPNGLPARDCKPIGPVHGVDWPAALAPLAPFADRVTIVGGLQNDVAEGEDAPHARGTGGFLTGARILGSETEIRSGISVDQRIVRASRPPTRFPSIELGLEGGAAIGDCDAGYSCAYQRNIAWAGPTSPLPKISSPRIFYDRLFAGTEVAATAKERERRRLLSASVLDVVREEARALEGSVSGLDRTRLDEYQTGLRELELRLDRLDHSSCSADEPRRIDDPAENAAAMIDLMAAAIRCDLTRVMTFMLANSGSSRSYSFIGVDADHHDLSHDDDDPEIAAQLSSVNRWQIEQFARLVSRLAEIPEGDGTVLDDSLLFLSSELSDGNRHDHHDLPVILAGGASGAITPGRWVEAPGRPIADLYLRFLHDFEIPDASFGDRGTSPLEVL
jgi:hypothetical protein